MNDSNKPKMIGYWMTTALVAFAFASGGAMDLARAPEMMAGLEHLGYPPYLATLLGALKVLGAIAVLVPGVPRLKEWAYAGMTFDLLGAAWSHGMSGDPTPKVIVPLVLGALVLASWALRPQSRRIGAVLPTAEAKLSGRMATAS
jgi:uncharacterized membrane protein YphA (DoxX/SURF4 family)